jgi:hypothetical protein
LTPEVELTVAPETAGDDEEAMEVVGDTAEPLLVPAETCASADEAAFEPPLLEPAEAVSFAEETVLEAAETALDPLAFGRLLSEQV